MDEILGLGTDILEIDRFRKSLDDHGERFLARLFSSKEQDYCAKFKDQAPHLAGKFAAKEAVVKALGTGFGKEVSFHDIEILNEPSGKPIVLFSDKLKKTLASETVLVSVSHSKIFATATAIWIKRS